MEKLLTSQSLCDILVDSLSSVNPDDLAFLFATGKNELLIRDYLGIGLSHLTSPDSDEYVAREWKKHDLAIIKNGSPFAIIEGKSYIHYDSANPTRLKHGEKSIKKDLKKDIEKIEKTYKRKGVLPGLTHTFFSSILFTVETLHDNPFIQGSITYGQSHRQGSKRLGNYESLIAEGKEKLVSYLEEMGEVASTRLNCGSYNGMKVTADFIVLEIRRENFL